MKLLEYRAAVIAHIKAQVPTLRSVDKHGGIFTRDSLKRHSVKSPAARIAVFGINKMERNNAGQFVGPISVSCYVICKGKNALDDCIDYAETIAGEVDTETFGLDNCAAAMIENIDVLHSEDADGIALAAVGWTQEITFGVDRHAEDEALDEWDIEGGAWPDNFGVQENETGGYAQGDEDA